MDKLSNGKVFNQTIQNSSLLFINNYLEIICALINAFRPCSVSDIQAGSKVAYYMLEKLKQQNNIQLRLSEIATEQSSWKI